MFPIRQLNKIFCVRGHKGFPLFHPIPALLGCGLLVGEEEKGRERATCARVFCGVFSQAALRKPGWSTGSALFRLI